MPSIRLENISWLIQLLLILLEVKSVLLSYHLDFRLVSSHLYTIRLWSYQNIFFLLFGDQGLCTEDMIVNMVRARGSGSQQTLEEGAYQRNEGSAVK